MNLPSSILVYGRDWNLLQTRCWILERAGFRVTAAMDLREITRRLSAEEVDLIVLCHTLSLTEYQDALTAARFLKPRLKSLRMAPSNFACSVGPEDFTVNTFDGPGALVAAAKELLSGPGLKAI